MFIVELALEYWGITSFVLGLIMLGVFDYAQMKNKIGKLIFAAEEKGKDWNGQERFEWVIEQVHDRLPSVIKKIITEKMLRQIVQNTFNEFKRWVSENNE